MRSTSYMYIWCLIRMLTIVLVTLSQFDIFSVSATTTSNIDGTNTLTSSISAMFKSTLAASILSPTASSISMNSSEIRSTLSSTDGSNSNTSTVKTVISTPKTDIMYLEPSSKSLMTFLDGAMLPSASSVVDMERPRTFRNKHQHDRHWGPFFEEKLNTTTSGENLVATAHLFTEAVLNCRVGMLKDKTVMWVRRTTEKVSLLTVGNITYSGDPRVRVKFQYPNNWRLLINPTKKEDAGIYMCQVSTHPPRVFTTNLTILEQPIRLIDDQEREVSDRYYKSGSTIDLQCQISRTFLNKEKLNIIRSLQPQIYQSKLKADKTTLAAWYSLGYGTNEFVTKGNETVKQAQFEKQFYNLIIWTRDEMPLPASTVKRSSSSDIWLSSRISILDATLNDNGNYSCSIGKLFRAIVLVQVLTGELPAAVQHSSSFSTHERLHPLILYLASICFFIIAFKFETYCL